MSLVHIYVDSSVNKEKEQIGIGFVFYHQKPFDKPSYKDFIVEQRSEVHPGNKSSYGERLAIFRAMEMALKDGYKEIYIGNDHLSVISKLNKCLNGEEKKTTELEDKIIKMAKQHQINIILVEKKFNSQPHKLARRALKEN